MPIKVEPLKPPRRRIAFLDRDGIVNPNAPNKGYVRCADQFQLMPELVPFMLSLQELSYEFILITNQQGVGKGLMSIEDLADIHNRMNYLLGLEGITFLDLFFCPHLATAGCSCRKPAPGMLLQAMTKHEIDPSCAVFIGDSLTDAQAGQAAGVRTFILLEEDILQEEDEQQPELYGAYQVSRLAQIVPQLVALEGDS